MSPYLIISRYIVTTLSELSCILLILVSCRCCLQTPARYVHLRGWARLRRAFSIVADEYADTFPLAPDRFTGPYLADILRSEHVTLA
ncbi:hypothetical protein BC628DRAFT_1348519, partial [Trametes gibbosa]